jgi:hypothetical protein
LHDKISTLAIRIKYKFWQACWWNATSAHFPICSERIGDLISWGAIFLQALRDFHGHSDKICRLPGKLHDKIDKNP